MAYQRIRAPPAGVFCFVAHSTGCQCPFLHVGFSTLVEINTPTRACAPVSIHQATLLRLFVRCKFNRMVIRAEMAQQCLSPVRSVRSQAMWHAISHAASPSPLTLCLDFHAIVIDLYSSLPSSRRNGSALSPPAKRYHLALFFQSRSDTAGRASGAPGKSGALRSVSPCRAAGHRLVLRQQSTTRDEY